MAEAKTENEKVILEASTFALSEYSSLREEMLKRLELQHQIITLTIVAAGTILSIGSQPNFAPTILLIYPPLSFSLAVGWVQHNGRIRRISAYIVDRIETKTVGLGWERHNY